MSVRREPPPTFLLPTAPAYGAPVYGASPLHVVLRAGEALPLQLPALEQLQAALDAARAWQGHARALLAKLHCADAHRCCRLHHVHRYRRRPLGPAAASANCRCCSWALIG